MNTLRIIDAMLSDLTAREAVGIFAGEIVTRTIIEAQDRVMEAHGCDQNHNAVYQALTLIESKKHQVSLANIEWAERLKIK